VKKAYCEAKDHGASEAPSTNGEIEKDTGTAPTEIAP
jgi:hypothetical protein